jgi:molybdenum cofactor cytidylyltransferase
LISAIVLAAGLSSRMGKPKLVLPLKGRPVLGRVLTVLRRSKVDEIVVVLGSEAELVRKKIRFKGEKVVVNPRYVRGMSTSIRAGLEGVSRGADAAVIVLGDQPLLSSSVVDILVDAFLSKRAPIIVPAYRGQRGNPVLFSRSVFPEIMKIDGDRGAKSVIDAHGNEVLEVEVRDAGVILDVDTPSDLRRAAGLRRRRTRGAS